MFSRSISAQVLNVAISIGVNRLGLALSALRLSNDIKSYP
jgi:hypothetical protein